MEVAEWDWKGLVLLTGKVQGGYLMYPLRYRGGGRIRVRNSHRGGGKERGGRPGFRILL